MAHYRLISLDPKSSLGRQKSVIFVALSHYYGCCSTRVEDVCAGDPVATVTGDGIRKC